MIRPMLRVCQRRCHYDRFMRIARGFKQSLPRGETLTNNKTAHVPSATTSLAKILDDRLDGALPGKAFSLLRALKKVHGSEDTRHVALIDSMFSSFQLPQYLRSCGIDVQVAQDPLHEMVIWNAAYGAGTAAGLREEFIPDIATGIVTKKGTLDTRFASGVMRFPYKGTDFLVYKFSWDDEQGTTALYDIVFEHPESTIRGDYRQIEANQTTPGHNLVSDVYRWSETLKDEMWVFEGGYWKKDEALWDAIRDASWDNIVLDQTMVEGLRRDTRTFFENRKIYQELGIVWKRGLLLLGPPGNGKTESIKVLLKESQQVALYVKSFNTLGGPERGVKVIFDHARAHAPCILVIEDLDSLVTPDVRSFFLNELDGLAQNEGILTIATTNHPERIDDAILNRPSRFDVKYNFALPTEQLRISYALKWIQKISALRVSGRDGSEHTPIVQFERSEMQLAFDIAKETDGWSYAFLKELFLSFLLRIAHDKTQAMANAQETLSNAPADDVLMDQVKALSEQILKTDSGNEDQMWRPYRNGFYHGD